MAHLVEIINKQKTTLLEGTSRENYQLFFYFENCAQEC